jgi:1-acyl-sn-glycerol-3-phosphate acyltransferase
MRILPEAATRHTLQFGPMPRGLHFGLKNGLRLLFAPFGGFQVKGITNIPDRGGFLLLPKHQRWVDIPYLGMACPRRLCYVAKVELFETRLGNRFFTALGGIPLDRRRPIATRHSLRAIRDVLKLGGGVVVFPEGTYVPGRVGDGRRGLLRYLIQNAPVPLVPVGIEYGVLAGRRTVTLRFGPPRRPRNDVRVEVLLDDILDRIALLSGLERMG